MNTPPELPTVELHVAFLWTCDGCGRDQFERAIRVEVEELDEEEIEELMEDGREIEGLVRRPATVTCDRCGWTAAVDED